MNDPIPFTKLFEQIRSKLANLVGFEKFYIVPTQSINKNFELFENFKQLGFLLQKYTQEFLE